MRSRYARLITLLLLVLPFTIAPQATTAAPVQTPAGFANPQFEQVWQRTDAPVAQGAVTRSWLWGPGPGEVRTEPFAGAPGGNRTVQYFDKARMEVNSAADPASVWATTTGLLVVELVSGRLQLGADVYESRTPAAIPVAGDGVVPPDLAAAVPEYRSFANVASVPGGPDRRVAAAPGATVTATIDRAGTVGALAESTVHYSTYAPETGHNIPDVFARFMQTRDLVDEGGKLQQDALFDPVYVLGYPISEAYWATVPINGQPTQVLIQLYQRRVLTYIPSFSPAWQVQMGNVGQHYFTWRYSPDQGATPPAPPPAANTPPPTADAFVHIAGSQFTYAGQPVTLKGTNYWLHLYPGASTWLEWDGNVVRTELAQAQALGVNTVRIGLPYDNPDTTVPLVWGKGCGDGVTCTAIHGWLTTEMTQLLQIAAGYHMKVLFTLFDWTDSFPAPGSAEYARQVSYVNGLVAPFAADDRVLGWDIHNEPDNYSSWSGKGPATIITWAAGIAAAVHAVDTHHPVTVGIGNYQNLWLAPQGKSLLDVVDFVSFHCYDAGGLRTQIDAIQAHTDKPILLEEMGWPTGPAVLSKPTAVYDEPTQQFLYRSMLGDVKNSRLVGVIQWMLQDTPIGTATHYIKPNTDAWFGLVRRDGSLKPAAENFRADYVVPPLPSNTVTNLPLTRAADLTPP